MPPTSRWPSIRKWSKNLAAQCWLWKDHTSYREAAEITALAAEHRPQYIAKCGNTYSSEWFWSKIWHCLKVAPDVFDAAYSWVELCDYIPAVLAGVTDPRKVKRGVCAAGHKAMYNDEWGGLPDKEFLALLDPKLAALRDRLYDQAHDATDPPGSFAPNGPGSSACPKASRSPSAHSTPTLGAIGSGIRKARWSRSSAPPPAIAQSSPPAKRIADIPGLCGIVNGAILPGYYGLEAGQSAVGDIFNWLVNYICEGDGASTRKLDEGSRRG